MNVHPDPSKNLVQGLMNSLPILLKNPKVLLIGAGNVGLHKAQILSKNSICFEVISEQFSTEFKNIKCDQTIKTFEDNDIESYKYIIDATGNSHVKERLIHLKEEKKFLLNVVDEPEFCDFYFSAIVARGKLKVAISTDGASPAIAKAVKREIDNLLPESLEELIEQKSKERFAGVINPQKNEKEVIEKIRRVCLIGCGPGNPELLTIQAYKEIQKAEVILYDNLVTPEIIDLVSPQATLVYVGKKKGNHSISQEEINKLLGFHFHKGKRVARLKSGDPFIFGRGAEEALYLQNEKIPYQVINGLSSSISAPALTGFPLTARGFSAGFSVVSAHLKNNQTYLEWVHLLDIPNHTVVVLMGLSLAERIKDAALKQGIQANKKVAIVSNASRSNQEVVLTTIERLDEDAKKIRSPAIFIFGGGVDFSFENNFSPYIK